MTDDLVDQWRRNPNYRLLQAEISALDDRLDGEGEFGQAVRDLWTKQQGAASPKDAEHLAFYRNILTQMMMGKFERIVTPDPVNDVDSFGASLVRLNMTLDRKFAEVRALSEVSSHISEGLFVADVLNHVFDSFRTIIPYDHIRFAVVETNGQGGRSVRTHWARSDLDGGDSPAARIEALDDSTLSAIAVDGAPRIINDLPAYLQTRPDCVVLQLMVQQGAQSSLICPLIDKKKLMGYLFFSSRLPDAYVQDHIAMFANVGATLAQTLEKSLLYEGLTVRNAFIRSVFGRYISDEIADALLQDPQALNLGGRKCKVTVLLSDIRGFTAMSEHMDPEQVVAALNTCFSVMVDVIHKHNGTIDNIIGDALMVLFGAPIARDDDAIRAVACALAMQDAMVEVNRRNRILGLPELDIGIGINTGDVVAGNIGSEAHAKYSVIGAPVNMAARLEAKAARGEVLLSQSSYDEAQDTVRLVETREVQVKGFTDPVRAFSVAVLPIK